MAPLNSAALNGIICRAQLNEATPADVDALIDHIEALEDLLDKGDVFGGFAPGGWMKQLGIDE
jgi:hypothetical protein